MGELDIATVTSTRDISRDLSRRPPISELYGGAANSAEGLRSEAVSCGGDDRDSVPQGGRGAPRLPAPAQRGRRAAFPWEGILPYIAVNVRHGFPPAAPQLCRTAVDRAALGLKIVTDTLVRRPPRPRLTVADDGIPPPPRCRR